MDWSSEKIVKTVEEIRDDFLDLTEIELNSKYSEFKKLFPKLYYTCMEKNFNITELKGLLEFRDKSSKENKPDIVRDATVAEHYSKKYLYPVVGEPTMEQKKEAGKKIAQKMSMQK